MTVSRPGRLGALLAAVAFGCVVSASVADPAFAQTRRTQVRDSAEAWYAAPAGSVACEAPTGCAEPPTAPASPPASPAAPADAGAFPKGTLHVAMSGGAPSAVSYLMPDLSGVPLTAKITGTLVLPLSRESRSGNARVDSAGLQACLATEQITDGAEGSATGAPAYDCDAAHAKARLLAGSHSFVVRLDPFLAQWSAGIPAYGVALVPEASRQTDAAWHLSFNGKRAAEKPRIVSRLSYSTAPSIAAAPLDSGSVHTSPPPPLNAGTSTAGALPDAGSLSGPATAMPGTGPAGSAPQVSAAKTKRATPVSLVNSPWYTYRGVVFLPLAFIVGLGIAGRSLTKPLSGSG
jgi:hypothetical protein